MRTKSSVSWLLSFTLLVFLAVCTQSLRAQCYLSQGCQPVDNLTYAPNPATGQEYHGDGASNNGSGGWTTNYADVNQCLGCHYGADTLPYLWTGHKNTLRKIAPTVLWSGPDGTPYLATDDHYASGSAYNWSAEQVTMGWCTPLATTSQNGLPRVDATCQYPYYTLPNSHSPTPYDPVPSTLAAGGVRNLYYLYGGWEHYGGSANPSATHLNAIVDSGFIGDLYPNGNFDCARCHATGYTFDQYGPEPTANTGNKISWIGDARLRRIPTDGYVAPGTSGTSSWFLTGVQCERCHIAANGSGSHPWSPNVNPTVPQNEAATALCMECHREEVVTMANENNGIAGSIEPANAPFTYDGGYCSDLSGSAYATCITNPANQWVYKPHVRHEAGTDFLNSPHARFVGTLSQNAQNSADLSVVVSGSYTSPFTVNVGGSTKNAGCTGCHDPHQSTVSSVPTVNAPKPIVQTCDACHQLARNILQTTIHPAGPGTPFPTGTQADIPGACVTCHMQAALGTPNSHLFRINADPNYWTFPTPDQLYNQDITALSTAPELSPIQGTTYNQAAWLDVDLACGQCHVGNDGVTNEYGLTMPPGMPGSHAYTRAQLAYWASVMHPGDPGVPTPAFSPQPSTYNAPQTVSISDSLAGATIYYTKDGSLPNTSSPIYSTPITIAATTTFKAMARYPGMPGSILATATYTIVLPTAPPPLYTPPPSTFSSSLSVSLSNTAHLPMYYTMDGSVPTTGSTLYSGPISITKNTTISAITAGYSYLPSAVTTGNYSIQAPVPNISPGSGSYSTPQNVTISSTVAGATIYYTTDGSTPTTSSAACANPCSLTVSANLTLKAIATGGGYATSNVALASYSFATAAPMFLPSPNTFYAPVAVTISDSTAGATIYYSTTGFPTTSSPSCASPCTVNLSTTTTLRAMAVASGMGQSSTTAGSYTIAAAAPSFAPTSGSYGAPLNVTITEATSGVTLYYSTTGFPTTSSPSCSSPCTFTLTTPGTNTVRAMAVGNGISQSATAVATYTLH